MYLRVPDQFVSKCMKRRASSLLVVRAAKGQPACQAGPRPSCEYMYVLKVLHMYRSSLLLVQNSNINVIVHEDDTSIVQ